MANVTPEQKRQLEDLFSKITEYEAQLAILAKKLRTFREDFNQILEQKRVGLAQSVHDDMINDVGQQLIEELDRFRGNKLNHISDLFKKTEVDHSGIIDGHQAMTQIGLADNIPNTDLNDRVQQVESFLFRLENKLDEVQHITAEKIAQLSVDLAVTETKSVKGKKK
ncbi:hypothetical protein HGA34_01795 [Candidatus Falkowbacteria bacterium]|nr:hypothetical protein [Candidatus Falkowbacteria bacterium]